MRQNLDIAVLWKRLYTPIYTHCKSHHSRRSESWRCECCHSIEQHFEWESCALLGENGCVWNVKLSVVVGWCTQYVLHCISNGLDLIQIVVRVSLSAGWISKMKFESLLVIFDTLKGVSIHSSTFIIISKSYHMQIVWRILGSDRKYL